MYKQILINAEVQIRKRGQKTVLIGRSSLRRWKFSLDSSAFEEEKNNKKFFIHVNLWRLCLTLLTYMWLGRRRNFSVSVVRKPGVRSCRHWTSLWIYMANCPGRFHYFLVTWDKFKLLILDHCCSMLHFYVMLLLSSLWHNHIVVCKS